ncbi:MAG: glutamine synthetase III [Clostridia bacterium]|nr:glutamine synthetase III [Clostridia bacterium]
MTSIPEIFGSMVFGNDEMKKRLPEEVYKALHRTIEKAKPLDKSLAAVIAQAMKDWAIEKGVTHYSHWFQPMTGITAEKHDSFIVPDGEGHVIMEFTGKELVKGESDASSFPSGGLRATFEARGYTAWDPSSYAFIKDKTLYIPCIFCSQGGDALDNKTPLLRSMDAIDKQAKRVLKLFGKETSRVVPEVGPEQEYFLIDKKFYDKRKDLKYTGRTLFGAKPPKGQEMDDHYFGSINQRVADYMKELDEELWKLGVLSKTKHNEAAPAQHEMAPIFSTVNISSDHNQITMEVMKRTAEKHGLVCLLHEKPFAGVNGSGKHNNWSLSARKIGNLLDPGDSPEDNAQFLLFLCAVIKAADDYQDLLRTSCATAGNDLRLGGDEAPPAIISIFLGDELSEIIDAVEKGETAEKHGKKYMEIGVDLLPKIRIDATDRNRTSPLAFTGNKFEFRMLGSADSISATNIMINSAVAESLRIFADRLEKADNFAKELNVLIRETIKAHKRIIFSGNNYSDEWVKEAEKRGLLNLKTTPDCVPSLLTDKNVLMLTRHGVFSEVELKSRCEIKLENYCKTLNIEALTMLDMAKRDYLPAIHKSAREAARTVKLYEETGIDNAEEREVLCNIAGFGKQLSKAISNLEQAMAERPAGDYILLSRCYADKVIPAMNEVRRAVDGAEVIISPDLWPVPAYGDLLFSV